MSTLSETIANNLIHSYQDFGGRVRDLAGRLDEDQFWVKPYPYGNSVGNLVLHLTGNLSYYIGAEVAGTGYVRDRDREFTDRRPGRKEEVLAALDAAVGVVVASLRGQGDADWTRPYEGAGEDVRDRFGIYLRCAAHLHHHIGQMIYLVKELTRAG